jgi:DNA-binding response OmpR family regulator
MVSGNYKVIIIEDDSGIAEGIAGCLSGWGMEVHAIKDFRRVMEEYEEFRPHLVIMDITLPYMGGYHWCQEIRKKSSVPIIFISSATDNMNIIMAMNMGADDYIPKPFDQSVLIAKVQALLRRTYDYNNSAFVLEAAGAVLNTEDNTLTYNGGKIELSRNEYRILLTLMQNKNKVVSREKLMEALWETDCFVDENTLTVNIGRLRRTLDDAGLKDLIKTKFGVGYILEA